MCTVVASLCSVSCTPHCQYQHGQTVCCQQHQTLCGPTSISMHSNNNKNVAGCIIPIITFSSSDTSITAILDKSCLLSTYYITMTGHIYAQCRACCSYPSHLILYQLSLVTFKLHPHFWQWFTLFVSVTKHNECTSLQAKHLPSWLLHHNIRYQACW